MSDQYSTGLWRRKLILKIFKSLIVRFVALKPVLQSQSEPRIFSWSWSQFKIWSGAGADIWKWLHFLRVRADQSQGFLAGAGANLKFDLEPELILGIGSSSLFWQVNHETILICWPNLLLSIKINKFLILSKFILSKVFPFLG